VHTIEMPFGLWARMGSKNHVLDGVEIQWEEAILGERLAYCKVYRLSAVSCEETSEPINQ